MDRALVSGTKGRGFESRIAYHKHFKHLKRIIKRKKPSKKFRDKFDHTPLSIEEKIPWKCRQLIIGNGFSGVLPVMDAVKRKAEKRGVELIILPTPKALERLNKESIDDTNAILHVTC